MDIRNKHILVVGLARTGVSVARFLASRGAVVTVTDMRGSEQLSEQKAALAGLPVAWEMGRHDEASFIGSDLIVVSPGVPMDLPQLVAAAAAGRRIISEIELAARFISAPLVAITGTNGKTTTTTLAGEIFRAGGFETYVGGNIGEPLIDLPASNQVVDRVVAEISSFQLEWIENFRPKVAALLNISEDHLDRYGSYREYIDAKLQIFRNQTADDFAVVNHDDELVRQHTGGLTARLFPFSRKTVLDEGIFHRDDTIIYRNRGEELLFPTAGFRLTGVHNIENIMAALACTLLLGCPPEAALAAVNAFEPLHHRMEFVRKFKGVSYYEDSKATNVGSVLKALESFRNITLIAGGKDKGGSYAPLVPLVQERVSHLILIGEAADRMQIELGSLTDTHRAATLEEAVWTASQITTSGGTVLMSPACSSFDMFRDYEDRARQFIQAVKSL